MPVPSRIAVVSVHSCPLARPGTNDAGGMNIYIRETARVMAGRGVAVDVFTREHHAADEQSIDWPAGCRVVHLPAGPARSAKTDLFRWLDIFADGVIAHAHRHCEPYDGIVSHYWLSGLVAQRLRECWNAPHIAGFHTLTLAKPETYRDDEVSPEREAGEREVIAHADVLLAATGHERHVLVANYGAQSERIVMAPPGVDTERFRPLDTARCRRQLGLPESGFRLLFAGRTIPMKGIPVLIESLSRLPDHVSAIIVGGCVGDREHCFLEETARSLGVNGRVRFEGSVPHERLPLYFGAADVCVVPSYYESYGMVALEALACGRPVVASRVGGLESVVDHGVSGLLIPAGSAGALSDAILTLLTNNPYRESLGIAGVAKARRCTWEQTTESILGALAEHSQMSGPAHLPAAAAVG